MSGNSDSLFDSVGWDIGEALRPGDVLTKGWIIHRIERLETGTRFAITTSPVPLRFVVEGRRAGSVYQARTEHLGVWVDSVDGNDDQHLHEALAQEIAQRVRTFAGQHRAERPSAAPRPRGLKPVFYLVPGHLGDPDDLSMRAVHVLASVPIIFVENEKAAHVRELLARFKLRPVEGPGAPEIVELTHDGHHETRALERWRTAVAAGLDTCLFGANEGIPGFCDPGKTLVIAASRMAEAVDVRTVGGSSVLGHALMRVPSGFGPFEFGGLLYTQADAEQLADALVLGRLPFVLFSQGFAVRAHLPWLLQRCRLLRGTVHILCAFTSDEERAYTEDAARFVPPDCQTLLDHQAAVVVIERGHTGNRAAGALIERIVAGVRDVLASRSRKGSTRR
jgi:16S rRNA C1402 (ribose-2'-O) methylase RsmI